MSTNINANINITVGNPSNQNSLLSFHVYNDHGRTAQVSQEISGSTGVNPDNTQVWVFSEGQGSEELKEKIEEIGFFGSPETYGSGSGSWAKVDLNELRESGAPVPPLEELPFVQQSLPGNSHIELDISSSKNFSDAVQLQESEGYAAVTAFLESLNVNLDVQGSAETIDAGLDILSQIVGPTQVSSLKTVTTALTDA
jgi:hypothetical protein